MTRRIVVTCTGCGETWEAAPGMLGALCGQGQVRVATPAETDAYATVECPYCDGTGDGPGAPCGFCRGGITLM